MNFYVQKRHKICSLNFLTLILLSIGKTHKNYEKFVVENANEGELREEVGNLKFFSSCFHLHFIPAARFQ